jgi:hypothetical protein
MAVNNVSIVLSGIFLNVYSSLVCRTKKKEEDNDGPEKESTHGVIRPNSGKSNLIINEEEDEDEDEDVESDKINVPLIIILFIMIGYVILGGYGFTLIEKWTLIQGIYYSLISISTIGI